VNVFRAICALPFLGLAMLFEALGALILGGALVSPASIVKWKEEYALIGNGQPRIDLDLESAFAAARFELATAYDREREKLANVTQ
jgi:hypothetical protein